MRKNSPRKWLHACLDLLPVILIPVFMIYSHRHDVAQDFEISTPTPVYFETNDVVDNTSFVSGNVYLWNDNYTIDVQYANNVFFYVKPLQSYLDLNNNFNLVDSMYFYCGGSGNIALRQGSNIISITTISLPIVYLSPYGSSLNMPSYIYSHFSVCDFDVVKEYQDVITTIPKDVMTSFMDRFNNTIDNYFNMGNVFNLTGVYDWFNTNIFNGNAPQIIYSVWNIALYELVMDLLFLLYGLFMWFIDMVQHLMDKPFKSIK